MNWLQLAPFKKQHSERAQSPRTDWPVEARFYHISGQAGKGAHAVVYQARCKPFGKTVAIKRLNLDKNWDLVALIREATLMKKLNHPNVLPLHAAFVHDRELWMVMPFMNLGSLRSIMKREFPEGLAETVIATIMKYVLLGLEYMHKNGGIHRDVKADNILLAADGEVVLADFGVAACRNTSRNVSMVNINMDSLMATTFVGTPCWMAPEVMQQEDGYSTSADIWSFGITMIELAHGRPPLAKVHPMRVLMDTMQKPAPCLQDHPSGRQFSRCMKEVVELCLQKDPDLRPTTNSLLNHRFFKAVARDTDFLVNHFLAGLAQPADEVPGGKRSNSIFTRAAAGSAIGMFQDGLSVAAGRLKSSWWFPQHQQQLQPQLQQLGPTAEDEEAKEATAMEPLVMSQQVSSQALCQAAPSAILMTDAGLSQDTEGAAARTVSVIISSADEGLQPRSSGPRQALPLLTSLNKADSLESDSSHMCPTPAACDTTALPCLVEVQLEVPRSAIATKLVVAAQQQQSQSCHAAPRRLFKATSAGAGVGTSAEPLSKLLVVFNKLTRALSLGSNCDEAKGDISS